MDSIVSTLTDSLINLNSRRIQVIFVGPGEATPLLELSRKLHIEKYCEFRGPMSRQDILELYQCTTVAAFPTLAEAFGLTAVEALACGAPLVASSVGGLKEIIENERSGILVPPGNVQEWTDALGQLLSNEALQLELSKGGQKRAKFFDIHERAKSYGDWGRIPLDAVLVIASRRRSNLEFIL